MSYNSRTPARAPQGRGAPMQNLQGRVNPQSQQQMKTMYHQQGQKPITQPPMPMMQGTPQGARGQQGGMGQTNVGGGQYQQHHHQQQQQQQQQQYQTKQQQQIQEFQECVQDEGGMGDTEMEEVGEQKKWIKTKSSVTKVSKKVKRKRLNMRLRRVMQPKSPFMVLNELKSGVKYRNADNGKPYMGENVYTVMCEVDGKEIPGRGVTIALAKRAAAENAIKAVIVERVKQEKAEALLPQDPNAAGEPMDSDKNEEDRGVPWCSLASFALYKMLSEWTDEKDPSVSEIIPHLMTSPIAAAQKNQGNGVDKQEEFKIAPMKTVPENPTDRHPVVLLNHLLPRLTFDMKTEGVPPSVIFIVEVTVEDKKFAGRGRNKKEAKRECAKSVLGKLYNIIYPPETTPAKVPAL